MSETRVIPAHHKAPVPAMVRRSAELAEAAFQATQQAADGGDPDGVPTPAPDAPAVPPAQAPSQPDGQPAPPPPPPPAPPPPIETVDWKHRFDSLKGKHDQTLAQMGGMQSEIDNLHRVLSGMQNAQPAQNATPAAQPGRPMAGDLHFAPISDDERSDYGEEFISVAERAAAARLAPVIQELRDKVATLEQGVTSVVTTSARSAQQAAMEYLTAEVADWRALDTDQGFLNWLNQFDPMSGMRRQDMLNNALENNSGPRIAYFFKAYKDTLAPTAPNPPAAQASRRTSLETFAAPGRGRPGTASSAPGTGGNDASFSQSDIGRFYEDVRKGVFRNNPAEKARIEAEIVAASSAGRITAG